MAQENLRIVVFMIRSDLGLYEYGIPIEQVREITRPGKIMKIPGMAEFVEGVMNLREKVIPVIDLKKRFGLNDAPAAADEENAARIVVVRFNNKECGVMVDDISDIVAVPGEAVESTPDIAGSIDCKYIIGICRVQERLIVALDMNRILSPDDEKALAAAAGA